MVKKLHTYVDTKQAMYKVDFFDWSSKTEKCISLVDKTTYDYG